MKIDLKNVTLFIRRTTVTNVSPAVGVRGDYMVVKFGEGNLTWNIRRAFTYDLDRGLLDDVRKGDEEPLDVSFGGKYESVSSFPTTASGQPQEKYQLSIEEAVRGKMFNGTVHPWITAGIEREGWLQCCPYCVQIETHNDLRKECPDIPQMPGEAMLFRFFRMETCDHDVKAGTVNVTGKCNILRPYVMNPFPRPSDFSPPATTGTPEWLYGPDDDPKPFILGPSTVNPNDDGLWPYDRRDPNYPS